MTVALGAALAYAGTFRFPFVFDGGAAVLENPTIRRLWPLTVPLHPPADGSPVTGRPLTNLSFAVNYAIGRLSVGGYHALNLAIHIAAALLLFAIVRRTVGRTALAAACALLWAVHPLQTEAVTYVAQRSEALMGLCYLGALYCFIRGASSPAPAARWWLAGSGAVCLLGMAAKEVMATAPIMILLYDRTFLSGSFRAAWRQRSRYYIPLAATWLLLAYLAIGSGTRGGTIGFHTPVSWFAYGLTQLRAVVHYLRLCFWPHPLVIDYGPGFERSWFWISADGLLVAVLLAATAVALWRRQPAGFLGAWFFGILAPTSSVIPVATEVIAEHRMYLSSAAVIVLAVASLHAALGAKAWPLLAAGAAALLAVTAARNRDYRTALALWSQTAASAPANPGAHNNLGAALLADGRMEEAIEQFSAALRLDPSLAGAHNNLGQALLRKKRYGEAIGEFSQAVRLAPTYAEARRGLAFAYCGWGNALAGSGKLADALTAFQASVQLNPDYPEAQGNLGSALLNAGRPAEALGPCETALRLKPDLIEARLNLGNALLELGRAAEAVEAYRAALRIRRDYSPAHHDLAAALHALGRDDEARAELAIERGLLGAH